MGAIRQRFWSFGLVLCSGFLLMGSLISSATLGAARKLIEHLLPKPFFLLELADFFLSFCAITLLLALLFKFLPDTKISWSDVWAGAATASLLFTTGKVLIGFYLVKSTVASAYGAAASLIILLVWIYYSAQILLLGAEITHVYAIKHGSRMEPVSGKASCGQAK